MVEWDDRNQHIVGEKEKVKNLCKWAWNAAKETYLPRWVSTSIRNPARCGFYMVRKHDLGNSVFLESFDGEFFLNKTTVSEWLEIPPDDA